MRLWHKDLIPVLPKKQLLAQWRECCCIARNITVKGTPNHLLVNKILEYPYADFAEYSKRIHDEMLRRGFRCDFSKYTKWLPKGYDCKVYGIFKDWHNDRYLHQCYYNLEEKYDCGGIPEDEWSKIDKFMHNYMKQHL